MKCHFCENEIKGKSFKSTVTICHPMNAYRNVEVCRKCHYFPSTKLQSNLSQ